MTITHELEVGRPGVKRFGLPYTENRVRTYTVGMVTINCSIPSGTPQVPQDPLSNTKPTS